MAWSRTAGPTAAMEHDMAGRGRSGMADSAARRGRSSVAYPRMLEHHTGSNWWDESFVDGEVPVSELVTERGVGG